MQGCCRALLRRRRPAGSSQRGRAGHAPFVWTCRALELRGSGWRGTLTAVSLNTDVTLLMVESCLMVPAASACAACALAQAVLGPCWPGRPAADSRCGGALFTRAALRKLNFS